MDRKELILTNKINYIVLTSIIYNFLFPQYALAASGNMVKSQPLRFDVMPSVSFDNYQINADNTTKTEDSINYLVQVKRWTKVEDTAVTPVADSKTDNSNSYEDVDSSHWVLNYNVLADKIDLAALGAAEGISKLVTITAYSSTPDQTDDTPFITASNMHVRDGIIAANFLPFGTKVKFPALYGDKEFVVEDRMKSNKKVDIWFPTRRAAQVFGIKRAEMVILPSAK